MNKRRLKEDWKSDLDMYDELIKESDKIEKITEKIKIDREDIFDKMGVNDKPYQIELINLIYNVIHEKETKLRKVKNELGLCFTPNTRIKIQPVRYYLSKIKRLWMKKFNVRIRKQKIT